MDGSGITSESSTRLLPVLTTATASGVVQFVRGIIDVMHVCLRASSSCLPGEDLLEALSWSPTPLLLPTG
jgi:hypothetical protein